MNSKYRYCKNSIGSKLFDIFNLLLMAVFSFIVVFPLYNQLVLSLNQGADAMKGGLYFYPRVFSLDAYIKLFETKAMFKAAGISVMRVAAGTATGLFMTGLLAYIVTIKSFSGRRFMRVIFIITMYFSGGLIPFYILLRNIYLTNTFFVYIIPTLINTYYMLLISSYIQNLADSLFEAPRIDGCSEFKIYCLIVIPISLPVFAAIAVYLAVYHWNSWFDCMIYNPSGRWDTLQVYLRRLLLEMDTVANLQNEMMAQSRFRNLKPITFRAATTVVVTAPIILIYPFFQKYFIGGITLGAVKG